MRAPVAPRAPRPATAVRRASAVAVGLAVDRVVGEPPWEPHPVALFGQAMTALEDRWWADDRRAGARHLAAGVALGAGAGVVLGSTAAATALAVAGRSLGDVATDVGTVLRRGDLERARRDVQALVGRDTTVLDTGDLARAVIESVAENTVDAVVAPALWALAGGAPGALGYRAVNTLDAMVGHRTPRYGEFGWASARADDVANWVPARVTAVLVAVARPARAAAVWRTVRRDAGAHPSPNGGVAEAAYAAALGVRLGGTNRYEGRTEDRGTLGDGRAAEPEDIERAVRLLRDVTAVLGAVLLAAAGLGAAARRGRPVTGVWR